ncbi:hypothetical protein MAA_06193 [Metarhizium robertsii ARSEF 23]|uniref:Uncharacterized protein n=1 Tax=Metarhizium robertsii (strain ARSEF 23 / ATCC MYA-3075) TaxID=655844 RepID=E9F1Z5_METRA|nr:uncharacterized protein MAA_06193 [Metarhizium robertsii ARSEF 23]EFY98084.1 hypothetical protein MAA_06193 [Metarhizium robertsii ARSEF 23]
MLGPHTPQRHPATASPSCPRLTGRIMWLPTRDTMDLGFEPGVYNHPVVVLSPMLSAGELTSFGGTSLVDKFPTETKARGRYLPIKPSAPHPDNKILLELCEAEDRLIKDSYVNIGKVLRAKFKALRPYVSHRLRTPYLADSSYRQLILHAQYPVPGQLPRGIAEYGWTLVLPPSQTATRPQRSRYDIPDRPVYGGIKSPGRLPTSFSYSQTSVTRQARYNERAPLLPSPQPANPPRPQRSRYDIPDRPVYGGIQSPGRLPTSFSYSQTSVTRQARYNERAPLLPSPQSANPPRPALTRRIWGRVTHAGYSRRLSIDWIKVFAFFWALVIILAAGYGIYWLVEHLVQLVAACWLWLQHAVTHMVAAIKNWFGNLLGHGELI